MFAFDVSLCEISTFGANEEMHRSVSFPFLSFPFLSRNDQQVMSQTAAFKKSQKMLIQFKISKSFKIGLLILVDVFIR